MGGGSFDRAAHETKIAEDASEMFFHPHVIYAIAFRDGMKGHHFISLNRGISENFRPMWSPCDFLTKIHEAPKKKD